MDQRHISETELDEMWLSGAAVTENEDAARRNIIAHCQECSACNNLLNSYLGVEREIESLSQVSSRKVRDDCPQQELWLKLQADVLPEEQAMLLLRHASACDRCAEHLSTAQKYFAEDLEEMPERKSATPEWQAEVARKIALHSQPPPRLNTGQKERTALLSWTFWAPLTAAISVVAVAIVWFLLANQSPDVEKLLGQAYSENRTLEPRFARAPYGRIQIERGPNTQSRTDKPPSLLKAEESLSRHLRTEPNNPVWLDLKARADLLDGNYAAALKSLEDALQIQPDSTAILTDAATAYFEVAEIEDRPQGYGKAIDLLSRILVKQPDDPVALYNRALAHEKMFLYSPAIEDWQHYLRIDSQGEWAEEARRHLSALRKKLADYERRGAEALLGPLDFVAETDNHQRDQPRELVDNKAEQYMDQAVRKWLPIAFPQTVDSRRVTSNSEGQNVYGQASMDERNSASASQPAVLALRTLSEILLKEHDDHWLSDLMGVTQSSRFADAVRALQQAAQANSVGDFATAKSKSVEAVRLFRQAGNVAGEMRAQCELIYALERSFQEKDRCLLAAAPVARELRHHQYPWIQVQLHLEQSNCWSQIGDFGKARRYVDAALSTVEKSRYPILHLRAVGMAAALQSRQGNAGKAYSLDRNGLAQYWAGSFPPMRAYQFYSDLCTLAEEDAEWNFALVLAQEAVTTIASARQPLGEAFAHHRFAKIALMAGDRLLAMREFDEATRLFAALPQTKETWAYQADAEIELAKLQAAHGDAKGAWIRLSTAGTHISQLSHYSIALSYYRTLVDLQRLNRNSEEVVRALHSAIAVAEDGLGSLKNEDERLMWARETNQVYRDLAESVWRSHDIEGALQIWELYQGAAVRKAPEPHGFYSGRIQKPPAWRSNGILRDFPALAGQTTISYLQISDGLIVWVIDGHGIAAKWIGIPQHDLNRLVRVFRDECADRNSNLASLRQHARRLYDLLIAPIADQIHPDKTLVIELDNTVAAIPMAALIDSEGHYFGETHMIVISPGLLYQRRLRDSKGLSTEDRALVVGSPAQNYHSRGALEPLDNATDEAHYVATKFRVATLLIGDQATLDRVRHELVKAKIFHYAGHGITIHGKGGLLLASPTASADYEFSPTLLDATILPTMRLDKLQVAVFSACSTAGKGENGLEDSDNLVRFFLRAGVPHVVAGQWNVDSITTAEFMRTFYDNLLAGSSVPLSVRIASAQVRRQPGTAHPYYWAPFVAYGI